MGLIALVSVPFIFWRLGSYSFLDPDQGMWGAIAREMAEGGDWITPHFNTVRYLEKPPLFFWLTALITAISGPSEWATRMGSALPAFGTALLVWRIGNLLYAMPQNAPHVTAVSPVYGHHAGLLAAIIFLSNVGVFHHAGVPATDLLLVFSLTLAMYGFVKAVLDANGEWRMANGRMADVGRRDLFAICYSLFAHPSVLFWLGMGLGVLTKGLIGLVFPLLIVGLFFLVNREWRIVNGGGRGLFTIYYSLFANPVGISLFLPLVLPWHLLAAWRNPGFFGFYVVDNQFLRFLNSRAFVDDDIPVTTVAFLLLGFIWFFPWSLFLPAALRQGFPRLGSGSSTQERLRLVVGLWVVVVLGFFSLSFSKLEHYFLPVIPPLSLMTGALWAEAFRSQAQSSTVRLRWCLGVSALGCSLFGAGLFWLSDHLTPQAILAGLAQLNVHYRILQAQGIPSPFDSVAPFVQLLKGLSIVLIVAAPLSYVIFRARSARGSFASVLALAGAIAVLVFELELVMEPYQSSKAVAQELLRRAGPADIVVHEGYLEKSAGLSSYTGRPIHILNGREGDLDFGSHYPEAGHLFLDDDEFLRLWAGQRRVFLVTTSTRKSSILESLPGEKTFLIGHFGLRSLYGNKPDVTAKSWRTGKESS